MKEIRNYSEKEVFAAGQYKKEKMYWLDKLSGNLVKSHFPYDRKKTGKDNKPGMKTAGFQLQGELFAAIMEITNGLDHRVHMFLAAALVILLGKYSGNHDIIFGTPIYKQEIEGEFINTVLILRNKLENNMSFRDVLLQVRQTLVEAAENQNYPLETLLYQLDIHEYLPGKECPLFDVVILLENIHDEKYLEEISPNIIFSFLKTDERVEAVLKYNSLLYDGSTIERISTHFNNLLQEVVFNRNLKAGDINILSPKEKEQLLLDFNDTYLEYPQDKTASELFEVQAAKNPDNTALVEVLNPARLRDCSQLTYRELNKKANQLARLLRSNDVKPGAIVAVVLERSLEMLIAILGIWKAGGAYLPINPETPRNRILTMLQDCQVSIILTMTGIFKKDVFRILQEFRSHVTIPFKTDFRPQIKDFDRLPFPDRSLVNYEKYNKYISQALVKNAIAVQASRGCPFLCSYCHKIWPKNCVTRSAENIFAEVKQYYNIGVRRFVFIDDIFNFKRKNSQRFFEMVIESEMDVQFFFPNGLRGDLLTKEYIDLMVKAGTVELALALETASPRLQKLIKKNLDLEKLHENIEYITLKYPQVILEILSMHGFPTETEEEAMKTLDFIKSIKWLHFSYVSILKIYPGTDIEKLALENGISKEAIAASDHLAGHELPDTLPFDKSFTLQYQSDFFNNFFLSRERLLQVLPYQMKLLTEDEMVQKYNSFLPTDIGSFADVLDFVGITAAELGADTSGFVDEEKNAIPHINRKMRRYFPLKESSETALKVLMLDLSQFFTADKHSLYDIVEPPLGAMYLLTYLNHRLGNKINGRIAKSRVDFDNYLQLKALLEEFKPDVIGIRTLSFFKDFFHQTVAVIRQWGIQAPIISGGPYATSSYSTILNDRGVDLVVLGEGEETFCELIEKMIDNGGKLPNQKELENIAGIAFIPAKAGLHQTGQPRAIMMDTFIQGGSKEASNNLDLTNQSGDLAYVIFTSGSTGKPKGTMMEHISVNNLLYGLKDKIYKNYGFPLRVGIVAPFEFDASIQQISGALLQGHCLYIVPEETRVDGARLLEFYRKYNINISDGTPTHIRLLLENLEEQVYLPFIKHFIIAGEVLPIEVTRKFLKGFQENTPRISNMYGPTETCVDSTFYHISPGILEMLYTLPIGKPLPNQQVYIVDKENQLQPIGVAGELYIGGDGVARGYLNRPELTAEKFDRDLWDYLDYQDGYHRSYKSYALYKTGDLAGWMADGNIEFLGRIDHQVKIRGFRIELGEIESQLRAHECIKDTVVVAVEDKEGDRSLCAYYVEKAGEGIEVWPSVGEYFVWDDLLYYAMTNDEPRNKSYKAAIDKLVQGKTVVEIGTGPDAVLAKLCAEAGVKKVYAIELLEESCKKARETVERLNLEEKITVIQGDATAVRLPEKVDVCLSQIIGNIASSEGAIHILNNARRFLKEDGVMIPAACHTKIAAVQLPEEIHQNPGFSEISQIYPDKIFKAFGYKFDFRICIMSFPQSGVISNVETFENLNFSRIIDVENTQKVEFIIHRNARIDGFLLWINLYTTENEVIDTSENKYVWSPVFIPVFYPGIDVSAGDMVRAECIRTTGNNNICPDYKIKGVLIFKNGENLEFEYDFPYMEQGYRKNPFYQKLFKTDSINVVNSSNTGISVSELKEYLGRDLPDYLIPSYFVQLEEIPLSKNGKVDIKALVRPEFVVEGEYAAPRDEIEKKLAAIWAEVLSIEKDKIGIDSNFFDLGGHSLKATRLAAKMHKELNIQLPLVDIFSKSTIRELANNLREAAPDSFVPFTPIQPAEKKEFHTLSSAQKRLFILKQMKEDSIGYNTRTTLELLGNLERERLEETFRKIIKRHECLRTSFGIVEDEPVQRVHDEVEFAVRYYDLSRKTGRPGDREEVMPDSVIEAFFRPFDLSRAPLTRVGLIKLGESRHLLIIETHHIISDGTSVAIFVKDFVAVSSSKELPPLRVQYKDYSEWQNSSEQKELIKKQEEYWVNEFKVQAPILNLPLDYARPVKQSFEGNTLSFGIGKETSIKLRELAAAEEVTLFILLLAIYNLLLFKLTGQEDIVVGTGIEGRRHEDLRQIIGMMLNTLCFRNRPREGQTFYRFLKEVKEKTLQAFENQEYPFENLVEKVTVTRDTSRNPLFDVLFQLNNMETSRLEIPGIKIKPYENKLDISKLDITLFVEDGREELFFALEYCTKLFKETTINFFIRYFQEIASSVVENPNRKLWEIIRIPKERKEKILFQLNDELNNEINNINKSIRPIQTRLNKNLETNRDKIALEYGSHFITYAMLDLRSNYIANWLINRGMNRETPIGILMSDRMELVSTIIGVLKAGCVFVPLDPNHPPDRLALMIHPIGLKYLIVQGDDFNGLYTNDIFVKHSPDMIFIDDLFSRGKPSWFDRAPAIHYNGEDKIYIYFTSGTTGTPAAILGKNRSLVHFIDWQIQRLHITHDFRISQLMSPGFDAFLKDVLVPLFTGGVICIPGQKDILADPVELIGWIDRCRIHLVHCVPSVFRLLIPGAGERAPGNIFKHLKFILLSGETVTHRDLARWYGIFKERIQLVNFWGPTETTLVRSCYFIRESDIHRERIPVGKPIKGARVMVLNKNLRICDELVTGELYIHTPFSTYGYINNPELTFEKFRRAVISHSSPVIKKPSPYSPHSPIYRTGDLGRMLPDGNLEFLGRIDRQVKIQGVRIEPGEIEHVLIGHPGVKEAVVVMKKLAVDSDLLCAYITVTGGKNSVRLQDYLRKKLPFPMIPAKIIELESIPRKPNGKTDYDSLPDPLIQGQTADVMPGNDLEKRLAKLWSQVLGLEKISINDHFFELGGNSLKAMSLVSKIHKEFAVKIPLLDVFDHSTIQMQAEIIKNAGKDKYAAIQPVEKREYYELSLPQRRVWVLSQLEEASLAFNMLTASRLQGEVNLQALHKVFTALLERHESLRTVFIPVDDNIKQKIIPIGEIQFNLETIDLRNSSQKETATRDLAELEANLPFDLSTGPLLRVKLIQLEKYKYVFLLTMHHIISDMLSNAILRHEVFRLYDSYEKDEEKPLKALKIQYKDYAAWQNRRFQGEYLKKHRDYWLRQFSGNIPLLKLPLDRESPNTLNPKGEIVGLFIDEKLSRQLKTLGNRHGATLFMIILTAMNILLYHYSGQSDIVIGTPIAGREHNDLQNQIGFYLNLLPLRTRFDAQDIFSELLGKVRTAALEAFEHQAYPFDMLVEDLGGKRDIYRHPLFDVLIDMANYTAPRDTGIQGRLKVQSYTKGQKRCKFYLVIYVEEKKNTVHIHLEYNTDIFQHETIVRMSERLRILLEGIVKNPGSMIPDFQLDGEYEIPVIQPIRGRTMVQEGEKEELK